MTATDPKATIRFGLKLMKGYRDVAILAAELVRDGNYADPATAWDYAAKMVFPSSASLRDKGCPKGAFLGLCNAGLIDGVESDNSAKLSKNGEYAVGAVKVLQRNKFIATQPDLLWKKVAGNAKTHNHQMDVAIGIWKAGLIAN